MENKTVIISGGCGLLGSEFARTLKEANYCVIVIDNNLKGKNLDPNIVYFNIDITDEILVKEYIKIIYDTYGIDVLINCAAINNPPKDGVDNSFENYSLDKWKQTLDVNLTGSFLLSRECIKYMLKSKNDGFKGTIVNVTSQLGIVSPNQNIYSNKYIKPIDYSVAASAIIALTRYIACYYGNKIKSNCLIPSMIENGQSEEFIKNVEKLIPLGRMSKKDEFNSAIKFLCSEDSSYMTGQTLVCDGGYTSW